MLQIHTTAWTVTRRTDGIVTLSMRQDENFGLLRRALAEAGVPAVVLDRTVCPFPAAGQPEVPAVFPAIPVSSTRDWFEIRPSAMPRGTKILIGFHAANGLVLFQAHKPLSQAAKRRLAGSEQKVNLTTFALLVWDSSAALATPVNGHCST